MKKIIYTIAILISLVSVAKAIPIQPPATITIQNIGDNTVYYSFSDWNQYSDILCYKINDWTTKLQVLGAIDPYKTETLTFQPLSNYRGLCTGYEIK